MYFRNLFHIIITFCLLLSVSEMSKVTLLIYSSLHDNGCSVLLCTCSTSCSCSGHSNQDKSESAIPILIPEKSDKSSSCCPSLGETNTPSKVLVCNCNSGNERQQNLAIIQNLDKVIFFNSIAIELILNPHKLVFGNMATSTLNPLIDDIFHPPRPVLQITIPNLA